MRKLAPVVLTTTLIALCSGSAFALGDRAKSKSAPSVNTTPATAPAANVGDRSVNPTAPASVQQTPPSSGTDTTTGSTLSGTTTAPSTTASAPMASTTSTPMPASTEPKEKSKPAKKVAANKSPDQIGSDTRAKTSPDAQKGEASGGASQ
jgi:hypothetical protein